MREDLIHEKLKALKLKALKAPTFDRHRCAARGARHLAHACSHGLCVVHQRCPEHAPARGKKKKMKKKEENYRFSWAYDVLWLVDGGLVRLRALPRLTHTHASARDPHTRTHTHTHPPAWLPATRSDGHPQLRLIWIISVELC